ncbi:membrane protein insertase YidC [Rhodovulum adriaticum]|uniref:Membrane protein insertase YidC n=1 Tax=Rhodovulum adriaticum TaxID=35804 RepID=A0A4R2NHP9_RHOAD|nr:membrane protein insertase YidC [Rhodovulum adriaticum]MBK1636800.1 membrane protein insertase YidC [Rhodovulum adriaticum]TCP20684.1 protein translocase subunit yidC [Rhodovulum adriaticum]
MDDQNKNLILATALSFLVILVWFLLFPPPEQETLPPTETIAAESGVAGAPALPGVAPTPPAAAPETAAPAAPADPAARLEIDTPRLTGSISLLGGRIDQLALKDYRETLDPDSELVSLLAPVGSEKPYYALYGWAPAGQLAYEDVPGASTVWTVESGDTLDVDAPVTLRWDNGEGLIFRRTISVDQDYLFTVSQSVENTTGETVRLAPYGIVARHGEPETSRFFILHEGVVRQTDTELSEIDYGDMRDMDFVDREAALAEIAPVEENGWIGFTDKYWMTTLIPSPGQRFTSVAKYVDGADIYQVESRLPLITVAPGTAATADTMLFAGAKEWETIREYETDKGIFRFIDSIDWGWFFFFTKPIFWLLHWLNGAFANLGIPGSMGWAIIGLTLIIKAILLPLAYKSYTSMAKMKELQPKMEELKERCGDDRQKLQQEMMALYKKEQVNPAAGCLPLFVQIPVFFSLYKVIFVTIELRHAPWIGWIKDLSAPDPSSIFNLFGLLPWAAPEAGSFLALIFIGLFPLLLGISMWLQQKLNPTPTDPTQAMVFAWLPWVFMFMLGGFASGLVLYWIANNTITFIQQYAIMRSHGYKPDVFGNIKSSFKRAKPEPDKK